MLGRILESHSSKSLISSDSPYFESLRLDSSKYSIELSIPIYHLFNALAATPVVELPQNGSNIK